MRFSWDPNNAKINLRKHRICFEEATTVFYDCLEKIDNDSDNEGRFILVGFSQKRHLLFVVHVYKEDDETIQIISDRKATPKERRDFEEL